jgi:hypothetical protein
MILELELGLLCLLAAVPAVAAIRGKTTQLSGDKLSPCELRPDWWEAAPSQQTQHAAPFPAAAHESVEILKRIGDHWFHVGHRHANHPDIKEALATPGLAVRHADGSIHEGVQNGQPNGLCTHHEGIQ